MIELYPGTADQNTDLIFFLHFRFSLDMVKDDWPHPGTADQNTHLKIIYI